MKPPKQPVVCATPEQLDRWQKKVEAMRKVAKSQAAKDRLDRCLERIEAKRREMAAPKDEDQYHEQLSAKAFKPYRALTLQEQRAGIEALNENFNRLEDQIEEELINITYPEIERVSDSARSKIDGGDIVGLAALAFLIRGSVRDLMNRTIKDAYAVGVRIAAKELKIPTPGVPLQDTQIMNAEALNIANALVANLEGTARATIIAGMASGASTPGIIAAMQESVRDEASRAIAHVANGVVGEYINYAHTGVLLDHLNQIVAFQRSEVLDGRTCNMCLSLDKRTIRPTDPMRHLRLVHDFCRGFWVPIFGTDREQPEANGIPQSIAKSFDTIDGRPVINSFKQLKRPINPKNQAVQEEIKKRLKK